MLQKQKTLDQFGYDSDSLTNGSCKKVIVLCDYCQSEYQAQYKTYLNGREIVQKDSCKQCRYKKRQDVSLIKYGVKNSSQRLDVRKKISQNCEGFNDKRLNTILKRYGVDNPMKNQALKVKQQQTIKNKYKVDNITQSKQVRQKIRQTNLNKYGNEEFLASEEGKKRKLEGVREKYGVDNVFQHDDVKQKIKATNIKKYGTEHHFKNKDKAIENARKIVESKIKNGTIKLYNGKTISELRKDSQYSDSRFRTLINQYGFDIAKTMTPRFSCLEQIFEKWLIEQNINYTKQFAVENKFADFLLTDYNLIVELDGLYWHSELEQKDNEYHVKKRQIYINNGYTPLFFREDEINNKFDIIKSIILNKIGQSRRIFARKCNVINIDRETSKRFFKQNHLMGKGRGITYGLKFGDEIVSTIIIRKIRDKHYEISRFCHKLGYQVVGGFSRLIKHFLRQNECELLTTFIELRYGTGDYLKNLGFKFISCSPSFCWTNTIERVHRMKFRGNTGYEQGFIKIWDCGQARYDLQT